MKTGNIGIRNLASIGVADIDPYGTDKRKYKAFERTEKVKLRIGVFFDGTGNNRYNSDAAYYPRKPKNKPIDEGSIVYDKIKTEGSSYWNSYSNVALLHDLYEEKLKRDPDINANFQNLQLKLYVQGIGTFQNKVDDSPGLALGEGDFGVVERVKQACDEIAKSIKAALNTIKAGKEFEIISIQFDVFGFSRGAAAARHFCNEVLKRKSIAEQLSIKNQKAKTTNIPVKIKNYNASKVDNLTVVKPRDQMLSPAGTGSYMEISFKSKKNGLIMEYPVDKVTIEFVGIFDTVISQMLEKYGIIDVIKDRKKFYDSASDMAMNAVLYNPKIIIKEKLIELGVEEALKIIKKETNINPDDIPKVNPSLPYPQIKKVFHIMANSEWRENFPVTAVSDAKYFKEIWMPGAHSDIGGGYADTTVEKTILHFMDVPVGAADNIKQKMKIFREKLEQWYLDNQYCRNETNQKEIEWVEKHDVLVTVKHSTSFSYKTVDSSFMGNQTEIIDGDFTYKLISRHYELQSTRVLSNKLSLVAMKVMQHMAQNYGNVPFLEPNDSKLIPKPQHPEEYILPKELETYYEHMKKIAESGWKKKPDGKPEEYKDLFLDFENKIYKLDPETYRLILNKFVHLSANYNKPIISLLDHKQFVYTNVPQFNKKDDQNFQNPPYKRLFYTPNLSALDKNNSH
jgi:hypothetical protein